MATVGVKGLRTMFSDLCHCVVTKSLLTTKHKLTVLILHRPNHNIVVTLLYIYMLDL